MGGNTTPYIKYCSTWKSIVVVELKFYSLEKHSQLHGNRVVKPYCTGHHHYFTGKILWLYTYTNRSSKTAKLFDLK